MTNLERAEQYINILEQEGKFPIKDWAKEFLGNFARYLDQEAAKGHDKNCLITKGQGLCDCKANASESTEKEACNHKIEECCSRCCTIIPKNPKSGDKEVSVAGKDTSILPQKPKIRHIYRTYILSGSDLRSQIDLITDKINELINTYNNES